MADSLNIVPYNAGSTPQANADPVQPNPNDIPSYQPQPNEGYPNASYPNNNQFNYNPVNPNLDQNYGGRPTEDQLRAMTMFEINKVIPKTEGSSFVGMVLKPRSLKFATQNHNEQAFVLVRRHWVTNVSWVMKNLFYAVFPMILISITESLNFKFDFLTPSQSMIIVLSYYSVVVTNVLRNFLDWYYDPYIVTNERIIHYEFRPFTSYEVKEAMLENIEDVKEKSAGLIAGIFNYGDVEIRTASEDGDFVFQKIPNPTRVRDILSDLSKIAKRVYGRYN